MFTVTLTVPWAHEPAVARGKEWHDTAVKLYNATLQAHSGRAGWRTWGDGRTLPDGRHEIYFGRWMVDRGVKDSGRMVLDPHPAIIEVSDG